MTMPDSEELFEQMTGVICDDFEKGGIASLKSFVPLLFLKGKPLSFENHFPMLPFFKIRRPRRTVFMCGRQEGKCIAVNDRNFITTGNGRPVLPSEIKLSDTVSSVSSGSRSEARSVVGIMNNGVKNILRITTESGNTLDVTENHRILTNMGYIEAGELTPWDFHCISPVITGNFNEKSENMQFLSHILDKIPGISSIPAEIYDMSRSDTALFIRKLSEESGLMYEDEGGISFKSPQRRLIVEIKALLTKFGVITHLAESDDTFVLTVKAMLNTCEKSVLFGGGCTSAVKSRDEFIRLTQGLTEILWLADPEHSKPPGDIYGRELPYNEFKDELERLEKAGCGDSRLRVLNSIYTSDFFFDRIVSIEEVGTCDTMDIEVDRNHNFILGGEAVHNSVSLAASGIFRSRIIGNYDILSIQPRYEQIKRFSTLYVGPMLDNSPLKDWLVDGDRESSIMQRSLGGGGTLHYAYAFLTPDATRGYAVQELNLDEVQDINNDFIPIIEEVLSAQTEYGFRVFSGTPKALENTLNVQFKSSSEAYVHITCERCNRENIANKENHIYKMIGKKTCVCYHCGRPLNLLKMRFVHHHPERRNVYEGYHISQVTHPLHAHFPEKWAELVAKLEDPNYGEVTFENEILGLASAHNNTPLSEGELREACDPEMKNDFQAAAKLCKSANLRVLGVDWSGFGDDKTSTTAVVVAATFPGSDKIRIVYAERLNMGADAVAEARRIRAIYNAMGCEFFAHDFGGAGTIREALISQMGINSRKFVPFELNHAPVRKKIISFHKPTDGGRSFYSIDKTRSLMVLFQMIKSNNIVFPSWETASSVIKDLLNIMQESRENPRGGDFVIMERVPGASDDCAHAVNFACSTIWHMAGKYPDINPLADEFEEDTSIDEITKERNRLEKLAEERRRERNKDPRTALSTL